MKKQFIMLVCLGIIALISNAACAVEIWWDADTVENTDGLWSTASNWGTPAENGVPAGGPNSTDWLTIINHPMAPACVLDTPRVVEQVKIAEGGSGYLKIVKGGSLTASSWLKIAAGEGVSGTLECDGGSFETLAHQNTHFYLGEDGATAKIIIKNGGSVYCGDNFYMGLDGSGRGFVELGYGHFTALSWDNTNSIGPNSNLDIREGTAHIQTWMDELDPMIADGRITAYGGKGTIVKTWDAQNNQTVLTAIHPMSPKPTPCVTAEAGQIILRWDNLEPNHPGDRIIVDAWFGKDPNKGGDQYTKVLDGLDVTDVKRSSVTVNASEPGTYYWQVDTNNGAVHEGYPFTFKTSDNFPPVLDAGPDGPVWLNGANSVVFQLDATAKDEDIENITYEWTPCDNQNAVFSNPSVEDPTITFSAIGTYDLKLKVIDSSGQTAQDTVQIRVYADDCAAARGEGTIPEEGDINNDCIVDIIDLTVLASNWFSDYSLE